MLKFPILNHYKLQLSKINFCPIYVDCDTEKNRELRHPSPYRPMLRNLKTKIFWAKNKHVKKNWKKTKKNKTKQKKTNKENK